MTKYQEFLECNNIISERDFNSIIECLPEVNIKDITWDIYDFSNCNEIAQNIIDKIIYSHTKCAYCDSVNIETKSIEVDDVETIEELENIKNIFKYWTISNYEEIKQDIETEIKEKEEFIKTSDLINIIKNKASLAQLQEFVESL